MNVLKWKKSRRCANTSCVEVAAADMVFVRDSKPGNDGTILAFTPAGWQVFMGMLKARP